MINFKQNVLTNNNSPVYLYESYDESFVNKTKENFLKELNTIEEEYYSIMESHLYAIHYGLTEGSFEILEEGLKDVLSGAVKTIGKKIQSFIKAVTNTILVITSHIEDFNHFLTKHEERLKSLEPDFEITGFNYTFEQGVPNISVVDEVFNEFNMQITDISKLTREEIENRRNEFNKSSYRDKLRGEILGTGPILEKDFIKKIKKVYRNNEEEEHSIHIDTDKYRECLNNYKKLSKEYEEAKKLKDNTVTLLNSMLKFFQNDASTQYDGASKVVSAHTMKKDTNNFISRDTEVKHSSSDLELLNKYYSFKFLQASTLSSIVIPAVEGKISALFNYLTMMRKVIRKGLSNKYDKLVEKGRQLNEELKKQGGK